MMEVSKEIKVLLVDDEKDFLDQERIFLKKQNSYFSLNLFTNAKDGLKNFRNSNYDCVVSDYQMPGMDGLELLKKIRKESKEIPFIIFTGKGREEVAVEALNLGSDRYIRKGGNPKSQFEVLAKAITQEVKHYRAELKLAKNEKKYHRLIETTQESILLQNMDGKITFADPGKLKDYGLSKDILEGSYVNEFVPEDQIKIIKGNRKMRIDGDQSSNLFEIEIVTEDGQRIPVEVSSSPLVENNEIKKVILSIRDISERKSQKKDLKENIRKYRNFFKTSRDCAFIISENGEWIDMSDNAPNFFGFNSKKSLKQESIKSLSESTHELSNFLNSVKNNGFTKDYPLNFLKKNGNKINTLVTAVPFKSESEISGFQGTIKNITEQKNIKEELRKSKRKFKKFFDELNSITFISELNGEILETNNKAIEELGYSKDEIKQMNIIEDLSVLDTTKEKMEKRNKKLKNGELVTFKDKLQRKDGTKFRTEVEVNPIILDGKLRTASVNKNIEDKEQLRDKIQTILYDSPNIIMEYDQEGNYKKIYSKSSNLLYDKKNKMINKNVKDILPQKSAKKVLESIKKAFKTGKIQNTSFSIMINGQKKWFSEHFTLIDNENVVVSISRDITDRKQAEEREKLLHTLIRHDVRNKSQTVQGYLNMIQNYELPKNIEKLVQNAKKGSKENIKLINKVSTLKKSDKEEKTEINAFKKLKKIKNQYKSKNNNKNIKIKTNCPKKDCKVQGGSLVTEIFKNIIENSIKHSNGTKIKIKGTKTEKKAIITIEDDGKGIPDKDKEKIFNKGYTTDKEKGTGLGLYLAKTLIEIYNGEIKVENSELGGTKFTIKLQRKQENKTQKTIKSKRNST